jgi:hypothetical protein
MSTIKINKLIINVKDGKGYKGSKDKKDVKEIEKAFAEMFERVIHNAQFE